METPSSRTSISSDDAPRSPDSAALTAARTSNPDADPPEGRTARTEPGDSIWRRTAHGITWIRKPDGLYTAHAKETPNGRGDDGSGLPFDVPLDSTGVFYGGDLRVLVRPDGVSFDRGPGGAWSKERGAGDKIIVERILFLRRKVTLDDGTIVTIRKGEVISDKTGPQLYRDRTDKVEKVYARTQDGGL